VLYTDGTKMLTGYDGDGRKVAATNQDGVVTRLAYDGAGRLIAVTNALTNVTAYAYDQAGNLIAQVDAQVTNAVEVPGQEEARRETLGTLQ